MTLSMKFGLAFTNHFQPSGHTPPLRLEFRAEGPEIIITLFSNADTRIAEAFTSPDEFARMAVMLSDLVEPKL